MKYSIFIFLLAVVGFSCSEDDIKELATISRDFTVSESIDVSIGQDDPLSYSTSKTLDASLSGVDISNIEVVKVTGEVTSVLIQNGATNLTEARFEIVGTGVVLVLENIDLSNAVGNPVEFNLNADALATIQSSILATESITINASATVDNKPVDFTLELTFDLKASGTLL